jgi:hypothetical protein
MVQPEMNRRDVSGSMCAHKATFFHEALGGRRVHALAEYVIRLK